MHSRFVSVMALSAALAMGASGAFAHGMQGGSMQPPQGQDEMPGPGMMGPGGGYDMMGRGMMGRGMMGGGMMDRDRDEGGAPGMMGYGMGPGMGYGMMGYGPGGPWMMRPGADHEWHHRMHREMGYGQGYGWGYGMGPGMMGHGPGMMGPGMMGPGMMGPGMMGPGMMDYGYGMMHGCPYMDRDAMRPLRKDLSVDDVTHMMSHWIERTRNPNLKLGEVAESGEDDITADVVTKDGSLVRSYVIDKHTGATRPVDMEQ